MHDNHPIEAPGRPEDGYHLADDMAAKAVEFMRDAKVIDPDKPFFMYLAPQAGYISYNDYQLGRVLDYLEKSGQIDNTLIVVVSDNGASGEGGPNGSFNEWRFFNGVPDTTATTLPHIDELGTPASNNHHVLAAEFAATGPSSSPQMPGAQGPLTLFVYDQQVGQGQIVTQPGYFCLTGDGICVGRDSASAVTPAYQAPFQFTGGTIDRVVVDLSGDRYIDHESQVRAWFSID